MLVLSSGSYAADTSFHVIASKAGVPVATTDYLAAMRKQSRNIGVVLPVYPAHALANGVQGEVTVEFGLNENGSPKDIQITKSEPSGIFTNNVYEVFADWSFLPDIDHLCASLFGRAQQQIFFKIENGLPKVIISPVTDIKLVQPGGSAKPQFATLQSANLRYKLPPKLRFPSAAVNAGKSGFVVSRIHIQPNGNVSHVTHQFAYPNRIFNPEITAAMKNAIYATTDGKPLKSSHVICQDFIFELR